MEKLNAFIFLCLFGSAFAQITAPGPCPKIEPMKNFDLKKMYGEWLEVARYTEPNDELEKCARVSYSAGPNDTIIQVETSTCVLTGIKTSIPTYVSINSTTKVGNITAHLMGRAEDVNYLMFTDYKCWYVSLDCTTIMVPDDDNMQQNSTVSNNNNVTYKVMHVIYAWLYKKHPSKNCDLKNMWKQVEKLMLKKENFTLIRQEDCDQVKPPK